MFSSAGESTTWSASVTTAFFRLNFDSSIVGMLPRIYAFRDSHFQALALFLTRPMPGNGK